METREHSGGERRGVFITVLLILAVLLCIWITVQVIANGYATIMGHSLFRVVTGSMEPTIPVGGLLVCRQVGMDGVQVGDIICFRAQESAIFGKMMTHRVTNIYTGADGGLLFETKGDANLSVDGYMVTQTNFVGKVIWYTGANNVLLTVFSLFTNKIGFLACIVIPIFLVSGLLMKDCVKSIRNELQDAIEELEQGPSGDDTLLEMTEEERKELYERIRAELIEELKHDAEKGQDKKIQSAEQLPGPDEGP